MVYITLNSYLQSEREKGAKTPSVSALARDIGMHQVTLSRLANNQVKQLNLNTANKIIMAMRKRGFKMELSDLIKFKQD